MLSIFIGGLIMGIGGIVAIYAFFAAITAESHWRDGYPDWWKMALVALALTAAAVAALVIGWRI